MNNCCPQRTNVLDFLCLAGGIKIGSVLSVVQSIIYYFAPRHDMTGWIQGFQFAK
jgi:hypothetical protein